VALRIPQEVSKGETPMLFHGAPSKPLPFGMVVRAAVALRGWLLLHAHRA